jgi:hypothetical protein
MPDDHALAVSMKLARLREEANLLYVLLDAAHDEGRIDADRAAHWHEAKQLFAHRDPAADALLYTLLDQLDRSGAIHQSWIHARWSATKARIDGRVGAQR